MKAKELVGKMAIRTAPAQFPRCNDNSYSNEGIKILKVTDSHIVYGSKDICTGEFERHILNYVWLDGNWADYEKLMEGTNE